MTEFVTDSQFALYEGLISLAWADESLDPGEQAVLEDIFARHRGLSADQRQALSRDIQTPRPLADIWPRLTDPQDRARFLDLADVIFKADSYVDETEAAIYAAKLAKHLGTIDTDLIERDLSALRREQQLADKKEAEDHRAYAQDFGLLGYIKRVVGGDPSEDQLTA
ncbi:MAG: hypothetical protein AAGA69_10895 [Pseudomonadota bacterium]